MGTRNLPENECVCERVCVYARLQVSIIVSARLLGLVSVSVKLSLQPRCGFRLPSRAVN